MTSREYERLSFSEALEILADPYRRRLATTLLDHNPEKVTAIPDDLATNDEVLELMLVENTHVHLPKLEDAGVIEWDREENVIRKGPTFDDLRPLLELIDRHRDELPDEWF